MNIFFALFAISVPIFYILGVVSALRNFGKVETKPDKNLELRYSDAVIARKNLEQKVKSLEKELQEEHKLAREIMTRAHHFPDMRLGVLIAELFPPEPIAPPALSSSPVASPNPEPIFLEELPAEDVVPAAFAELATPLDASPAPTMAASISAETPKIVQELSEGTPAPKAQAQYIPYEEAPKRKAAEPEYIKAQIAPKPAFDWANWFSDNSINLLLFVGAFLVVAAVSFYMWSQWGIIDGTVKFGALLTFTAAWYAAGLLFNRGESFKTVGITFITIGAILTPFVGVGYQQFILGGDANSIGLIWLLTSIFSTVIYTILSLVFQRRYFTYFGTLSILAMLLSLVQVSQVAPTYFILAGVVTALILLVGRISLRFFPYLDNYMGQDYELSSIGTLFLSLAFGLGIVILQGQPPFFSVDVFAVGLVATIYLWVYCSLHHEEYYLLGAQLLTVLMLGHGAYSLSQNLMTAFVVMFIAQFALQLILHHVFKFSTHLQNTMHHLTLIMGAVVYGLSIFLPKDLLQHYFIAGMALILMMQLSYYVRRFGESFLYYGCVALSYTALTHALVAMQINFSYWGFAFVSLGLIETLAASFVRDDHLRRAQLGLSLFLMAASGFVALSLNQLHRLSVDSFLGYGTAFAALFGFAVISLIEEKRSYKLLPYPVHIMTAFVGIFYFLLSMPPNISFVSAAFGLAGTGLFYLAYRHKKHGFLMTAAAIMLYPSLATFLYSLALPYANYGTAFAILAALQIFVAYLPFEINLRKGVAYVGLIALGFSSFLFLGSYPSNALVIGTSFAALGIYALVSGYELSKEQPFFERLAQLMGIGTTMGMLLLGNHLHIAPYSLLGFSLALMGLLALFYRHFPSKPNMMSLMAASHLVLWFALQVLGISITMMLPYFLVLSALHLAFAYLPFFKQETNSAVATVGIWGLVVYLSIAAVLGHPAANQTSFSLIMVWLGLAYLAFFEESQARLEIPLVDSLSRQLPIIAAVIAYAISLSYTDAPFLSLAYALGLLYFLLSNYRHSMDKSWLYVGTVLLYPILLHGLLGFAVDFAFWGIGAIALSTILSFACFTPFFTEQSRRVMTYVGLTALTLSIAVLIAPYSRIATITAYPDSIATTMLLTALAGLVVFALFALLERRGEQIVDPAVHYIPILLAVAGVLVTLPLMQAFLTLSFAVTLLYFLLSKYRYSTEQLWLYAGMVLLYPILGYSLWGFHVDFAFWGIGAIALSTILSFACFTPFFTEQSRRIMTYVGLTALTLSSAALLIPYNSRLIGTAYPESITTTMLLTALAGLVVFAVFAWLERRSEQIVDPAVHYIPILLAIGGILVTLPLLQAPLTLSFAVTLLYFLLSNYRQSSHPNWLYAAMALLYPILIYSLWTAEISADYWGMATAGLAALQVLLLYTPIFDAKTRKGIMQIGLLGLSLSSIYLLIPRYLGRTSFSLQEQELDSMVILGALAVFAAFSFLELAQSERRVSPYIHLVPAFLAGIAYGENILGLSTNNPFNYLPFFAVAFALAFSLHLGLAYRHDAQKLYLFGMTFAFYPALLHLMDFMGLPVEYYPVAIAGLSFVLYLARKQIVGESGAGAMSFVILLILGSTSLSPYVLFSGNSAYQLLSWVAGYGFLLIFWHSRLVAERQIREFSLAGAVFLQYLMHLDYAIKHLGAAGAIFTDIQWFSGGLALLLLVLTLRESYFMGNKLPMPLFYATAAVALLPAYYQSIISDASMGYAFLGIIYGLTLMSVGILYRNTPASGLGVLGVIVAVLIPTGIAISKQAWWVILLIIGLVLIVASIILTTLRRNTKKKMLEA